MQENTEKKHLEKHIFICTLCQSQKEPDNEKYAGELRASLKQICQKEIPGKAIRVNASGCLGVCDDGIHAVVYPEQKWFKLLSKESIPSLVDYLKSEKYPS